MNEATDMAQNLETVVYVWCYALLVVLARHEWMSEWVSNKWRHSLNSWLQLFWTSVQQSQAKRMSAKTTHSPAALLDSIYALQQTPTLHLKHNSIIDMYWPRFKPLIIINTHLSALYYKRRQQKLTLWWHHDLLSDRRFDLIHSFIHIRLFSVVKTQPNMN